MAPLRNPPTLWVMGPKKGVSFTLTAAALVRRLVALVPPPNAHLTSFHGVLAPHAALRPKVT
ncbi:MAG: transposase, partial [Myxococcaceae bacterium]|nr:transposase [Myxococcaceae bacterium]